ncbi:hypothetical protein [Neptuniibacter marinus]|uniref:hypothetical protein n=1 Tax=Neptuniibacter marinus TaxID=1806670 RepID=UPI00082EA05B|nr:hypothetical protein [Neptuniibacter marinus]
MKIILVISVLFFLTACGASIQTYESYSKTAGILQTASIGGELYRVNKEKDLPNAFGKADLFGGRLNAGYTELRFMGLTPEGHIIFRLIDIDIESNETTMSRYGTSTTTVNSNTTANASVYGNSAYGTANTRTVISHYEKPSATVTQLPPNTVEFIFNPEDKILELEGVSVEVVKTTDYSISYVLHR